MDCRVDALLKTAFELAFGGRPGLRFSTEPAEEATGAGIVSAPASLRGRPGLRFGASTPAAEVADGFDVFDTADLFDGFDVFDVGTVKGCGDESFLGLPGLRFDAGASETELRDLVVGIYSR